MIKCIKLNTCHSLILATFLLVEGSSQAPAGHHFIFQMHPSSTARAYARWGTVEGLRLVKEKVTKHFQLTEPICTSLIKLTCSWTVALQHPTAAVRQALCTSYWFCFCRPCPCGSKWQRTVVVPPRPDRGTTPLTLQDPQRRTESPNAHCDVEGIQTWKLKDNVCFVFSCYIKNSQQWVY